MIVFSTESIFNLDVDAITNPVNCDGIQGGGLALDFYNRFKKNNVLYEQSCADGSLAPGKVLVTETGMITPKFVINFPTKNRIWNPSRIEYIQIGLVDFVDSVLNFGINSVAIPKLGCGLGGLDWNDVKPIIVEYCEKHLSDVEITICEV